MTKWSQQLYNEPIVSVKHKNHNSTITQSSIELQQCVDRQVELLYDRAMALSACAQFHKALQDATAIQALAPLSSLGYYAAGYLYMHYGYQQQAIHVLNHGLKIVSDPTHHQRLQSARQDATKRLSMRIDFISKLPFDIVSSHIIPREMTIPSNDAFSYLHVCKTWRERALQSTMLQCNAHEGINERSLVKITEYSQHIGHLSLREFEGFPFGFFLTTRFNCLRSLDVQLIFSSHCAALSELFLHVGHTLEDVILILDNTLILDWIPLSVLLTYCPNLVSLQSNWITTRGSALPDKSYPKVKKLIIEDTPPTRT
ncbi:hypothetical protein O0I10_009993 [Lichtheimia ornata]|uniref:Uncharacterized protein n=1 Tax=Lichtheimia ornata TaxID=688661 RepID=A0AAD7UWC7_9FUNG|nr:uncharacterized protein O0I10_009993 [Lichtheimia ornata]KAJ8654298.1 hypothetical protein O0I10_009993 [Lichtheimia ornata]